MPKNINLWFFSDLNTFTPKNNYFLVGNKQPIRKQTPTTLKNVFTIVLLQQIETKCKMKNPYEATHHGSENTIWLIV